MRFALFHAHLKSMPSSRRRSLFSDTEGSLQAPLVLKHWYAAEYMSIPTKAIILLFSIRYIYGGDNGNLAVNTTSARCQTRDLSAAQSHRDARALTPAGSRKQTFATSRSGTYAFGNRLAPIDSGGDEPPFLFDDFADRQMTGWVHAASACRHAGPPCIQRFMVAMQLDRHAVGELDPQNGGSAPRSRREYHRRARARSGGQDPCPYAPAGQSD